MTGTEQRIVDYAAEYMVKNGYPPTVRDITAGLDYKSTATVFGKLVKMQPGWDHQLHRRKPADADGAGVLLVRFGPGGEEDQDDGI